MWKIKEWFLHYKEAIRVSLLALFRWTLLAVCTGVLCGGIGTLFHLAVEWVTEQRTEHVLAAMASACGGHRHHGSV